MELNAPTSGGGTPRNGCAKRGPGALRPVRTRGQRAGDEASRSIPTLTGLTLSPWGLCARTQPGCPWSLRVTWQHQLASPVGGMGWRGHVKGLQGHRALCVRPTAPSRDAPCLQALRTPGKDSTLSAQTTSASVAKDSQDFTTQPLKRRPQQRELPHHLFL